MPTEDLPRIPQKLLGELENAHLRYMHFVEITSGVFSDTEITKDRIKYEHLYSPPDRESGLPVFDDDKCIEYVHLKTGIDKKFCAMFCNDFVH